MLCRAALLRMYFALRLLVFLSTQALTDTGLCVNEMLRVNILILDNLQVLALLRLHGCQTLLNLAGN